MEFLDAIHLLSKGLGSLPISEWLKIVAGLVTLLSSQCRPTESAAGLSSTRFDRASCRRRASGTGPLAEIWRSTPEQLNDGPPVLTIENFKGGVGKSTLSANIAAYYDWLGLKVLLIDFDYQGSLTDSIIKTDANLKLGAIDILERHRDVKYILSRREKPIAVYERTDVLAAAYTLNRVENRVAFKWLVGESGGDIRYNVHEALSSRDMRNEAYDIVIIDAPPRLTTASANALCASTHVLIPTMLDNISATATVNTLDAIQKLKQQVSPGLEILGVVPTFVYQATGYRDSEREALFYIKTEIATRFSKRKDAFIQVFEDERITRKVAFSDAAGEKVAFFENADVQAMFVKLGKAIALAIGGDFALKVQNGRPRPPAEARQLRSNVVNVGR